MEDEDFYTAIQKLVFKILGGSDANPNQTYPKTSPFMGKNSTPGGLPVTSHFGPRWGKFHYGIDIAGITKGGTYVKEGTPMYYNGDSGTVISTVTSGYGNGYGLKVMVKNQDGSIIKCAHLSKVSVASGTTVTPGTLLGNIGNTGHSFGAHLHFEYKPKGASLASKGSIDPYPYIDKYIKFQK
jgi:murein DD-endopeptidase MepM/ murein hydrolase activator NlpD